MSARALLNRFGVMQSPRRSRISAVRASLLAKVGGVILNLLVRRPSKRPQGDEWGKRGRRDCECRCCHGVDCVVEIEAAVPRDPQDSDCSAVIVFEVDEVEDV